MQAGTEKSGPNRLHLHLTSTTVEGQRQTVHALLEAGGRRRGSGELPFGRDIYMADPGGDEFCVIEPGNAYLEGCGFLGEVTCESSRRGDRRAQRFRARPSRRASAPDQPGRP